MGLHRFTAFWWMYVYHHLLYYISSHYTQYFLCTFISSISILYSFSYQCTHEREPILIYYGDKYKFFIENLFLLQSKVLWCWLVITQYTNIVCLLSPSSSFFFVIAAVLPCPRQPFITSSILYPSQE